MSRVAHNRKDFTGQRYGKWVVIERDPANRDKLICRCDCGAVRSNHSGNLTTGKSRSCGCGPKPGPVTHGMTNTGVYRSWWSMIARCERPTSPMFYRYGGRGVSICKRWRESFPAFLADMGPRPPGTSIDRIDGNGNYEPGNCRWATRIEQARNTSRSTRWTFRGETHNATGWAEIVKISASTLICRVRRGWPMESVLTTPVSK